MAKKPEVESINKKDEDNRYYPGQGDGTALPTNWEGRSKHMKCCTCMYYAVKTETIGRCRRNAPTLAGWPVMFPTDWCGNHKLNEKTL